MPNHNYSLAALTEKKKVGEPFDSRIVTGAKVGGLKGFRRLKWNEVVSQGDFVADGGGGFQPWEGPTGFRADAFVKPIYRRDQIRPTGTKKSK